MSRRKTKTRSPNIEVSPQIWKKIHPRMVADVGDRLGGTIKAGQYFAKLINRRPAFSKTTISRVTKDEKGQKIPEDLLKALCIEYELPEPKVMALTEEEGRLFEASRQLLENDPDSFLDVLGLAQSKVQKLAGQSAKKAKAEILEKARKHSRREDRSPPDGGNEDN